MKKDVAKFKKIISDLETSLGLTRKNLESVECSKTVDQDDVFEIMNEIDHFQENIIQQIKERYK